MTEKEMQKLTDMILNGLEARQSELDNEFYAKLDDRTDIAYSPHPVDQAQSEDERVVNKLHDLYGMQLKLISEEKFELAEEIKQTIMAIKENYKL